MKSIIAVFIILFSAAVFAEDDFPRPTGFVNDSANILTSAEEDTITKIAESLERGTTSEIAVVTVRTVKPQTIEEYSVRLFSKWGIGKKDKNNGVLLLVSVDDREVKIEVGYGLEGVLPDGKCGEIIREYIIPEFKNGRYGTGIVAGVGEIAGVISGKRVGVSQISPQIQDSAEKIKDTEHSFMVLCFILFFLIGILKMFLFRRDRRRDGNWHSSGWTGSWGGYSGGGGSGSFGGGGFGGFGGGSSGGGGAVGRW